jgi:hypothetical protein
VSGSLPGSRKSRCITLSSRILSIIERRSGLASNSFFSSPASLIGLRAAFFRFGLASAMWFRSFARASSTIHVGHLWAESRAIACRPPWSDSPDLLHQHLHLPFRTALREPSAARRTSPRRSPENHPRNPT